MFALLLLALAAPAHASDLKCSLDPADVLRATQAEAPAALTRLRAFAARKFPGSRFYLGAASVINDRVEQAALYPARLVTRDGRTLVVHTEHMEYLTGFALPADVRDTGFLRHCSVTAEDPRFFREPVSFVNAAGRVEATTYFGTVTVQPNDNFRDFGPHGCLQNCPPFDDGTPGICAPSDMCDQS